MKRVSVAVICLLFFCLAGQTVRAGGKNIIGETAWIKVAGVSFPYLARIDTGARVTSIHAVDMKINDAAAVPEENVGKTITFTTENREGKSREVTARISKVSTVKNSQGEEKRYVIEMLLGWKHVQKKVLVNLRDRSRMQYKLLIGRNWLKNDFLVDVDIKAAEKE